MTCRGIIPLVADAVANPSSGPRYQRNAWYLAAWPEELGRSLLPRVLLGEPVVFYRTEDGTPVALADTCPHRFVPLSRGRLIGDVIECTYHGLRFDPQGACVLNPHGNGQIPAAAVVRRYPVLERHGAIWFWPGDTALADPSIVPALPFLAEGDGYHSIHHHLSTSYRYDLLIDNLMDLSHVDYLHRGSFSAGVPSRVEDKNTVEGDQVVVQRVLYDTEVPAFAAQLHHFEGGRVDQWQTIRWHPGQVVSIEFSTVTAGRPPGEGLGFYAVHCATPAQRAQTHYFAALSRSFQIDNLELDEILRVTQRAPLEQEDGPTLDAQEQRLGPYEFGQTRPVLLVADAGAMAVRRVMDRLLAREAEAATNASQGVKR